MKFKRFLAAFLVLCMTVTMLPPRAQAAQAAQTAVDNSSMTVEGTNGFGTLLSAEIADSQAEDESAYQAGYSVTDLTFSGSTATVTYDALEEVILVVAVYTEDGLQMLASGRATVSPDETEATVAIQGEIPEYFYATAYLLDTHDYVPLCEEFSTPMYTQEMQALLASTVEDYDAERVYNLDGDTTTNFAVFAEDTVVVREQAGVNTVTSANDDTRVYVIENADATITSLAEGDVLAYPYGDDEILIVKVASITVSGTTATITGAELEMEEAFSHVKIESAADTDQFIVDDSGVDEGIAYEGLSNSQNARAASGGATGSWTHNYKVDKEKAYTSPSEGVELKASIKGSLKFTLSLSVNYYVATHRQYLELVLSGSAALSGSIEGEAKFNAVKLGYFSCSPVVGVFVSLEPTFTAEFKGEASLSISYGFKLGFAVEHNRGAGMGMKNRSSTPKLTSELKFEGSIFFGVDLHPKLAILSEKIAKAEMSDLIGFEITGKLSYNNEEPEADAECIHGCESCVEGEVKFKVELTATVQFLKSEKLKLTVKLLNLDKKLKDFYWSLDYGTAALTACPHRSYRVSVEVTDLDGNTVADTNVTISNGEAAVTSGSGLAVFYLPAGGHTAAAEIAGTAYDVKFYVNYQARKVALSPYAEDEDFRVFATVDSETLLDEDSILGYGSCGSTVYWALYGDGTLRIYGEGDMKDYSGPSYAPWYSYLNKIRKVVIEDGVTSIGKYSFKKYTAITSVEIADGVTDIGAYAFQGCTRLAEVTVPGSVTIIHDYAFADCTILATVTIQDGVQKLYKYAFAGDTYLTELAIPESVTYIGYGTFQGCTRLPEVTVPGDTAEYAFDGCAALKKVTILEGVTSIGSYAFRNCKAMTELSLPDSLTAIGEHAFQYCIKLPEVTIPGNVTIISDYAFADCTVLETVNIEYGVQKLYKYAFAGDTYLTELTIPESVTYIGYGTFQGCTRLPEVTIPGDMAEYAFNDCSALKKVTILEGVTSIGSYAFRNCKALTELSLPDSLTAIGEHAFQYCIKLPEVTIPGNVTIISDYAFADCTVLETVNIEYGVQKLYKYAFAGDTHLTEVSIPESVTYIGYGAFQGCTRLPEVTIPGDMAEYAFNDCAALQKATILEGVTSIGSYAFRNCKALTELSLPDSLTAIGEHAFRYCIKLPEVTIPGNVTIISDYAFADCTVLETVNIEYGVQKLYKYAFAGNTHLTEVTIPESVTYIGYGAFQGCGQLPEITIPGNMAEYAFNDCASLQKVTILESVTSIGDYAFRNCKALTELSLPDSLTAIGDYAFDGCAKLPEVTIPGGVITISDYAFRNCTALETVVIEEGVQNIYKYVFAGCTNLVEIVLPESILYVGYMSFSDCTNLQSVVFTGNAPSFGDYTFKNVTATVYYPANNDTWTAEVMTDHSGTLTWVPYTLDGSGNMVTNETAAVTMVPSGEAIPEPEEEAVSQALEEVSTALTETPELPVAEPFSAADLLIPEEPNEDMTPDAIFGGDYTTEVVDNSYILKTATFSGLVPGEEYVMLALVSLDADDVLAADNLLAILQGAAEADGTLKFRYVQRVDTEVSYVVACGMSNKNLKDATITFPEMTADGTLQAVNPTVVYGGETLVEGVDYEITGTVDFTAAGEYTCQIRGIRNYAGTVTCTYTVTEVSVLLGDVNEDGKIDTVDAFFIVAYYNKVRVLTADQLLAADVDANGRVDTVDAYYIVALYNKVIDTLPAKK